MGFCDLINFGLQFSGQRMRLIMGKIKIDINAFVYPMPMVLVGATVENRPNFMAVGWVARVTMPDNNYWGVGNAVGKAWNIGKNFKKEERK